MNKALPTIFCCLVIFFTVLLGPLMASDVIYHESIWPGERLQPLGTSKVEFIDGYRYSRHDFSRTGHGFRWKAGSMVPVYVDCNATEKFKETVSKVVDVWDSLFPIDLEFKGCMQVNQVIDGQEPDEEGLYVIQDTQVLHQVCGNGSHTKGCADFHPDFISWPTDLGFLYVVIPIIEEKDLEDCRGKDTYIFFLLLHEVGHALGFDHPFQYSEPDTYSVMNYYPGSTIWPTSNDLDVIEHMYENAMNQWGSKLGVEMDYTPSRPSHEKGCEFGSNRWEIDKSHLFCIRGGVYPYQVQGATLLPDYDNLLCYSFENPADVEIRSSDGQVFTMDSMRKKGDANWDGSIDIVDALITARRAVNLPVDNFSAESLDVNCDGDITIVDALLIARRAVGLAVSGWCN